MSNVRNVYICINIMSIESAKLAKTYQSKTAREHIYDAPDTYIGAVEEDDKTDWVLNENGKFNRNNIKWVPGLYKCFDEGIVNCRDHVIRLQQKKKEKGIIQVKNIDISVEDNMLRLSGNREYTKADKDVEYHYRRG